MKTIKLTVSYDGTDYVGWQSQKNGVAVQDLIEEALEKVCKEKIRITGSGRTDAGVHALGQVAHFKTESTVPPERFALALNTYLPRDIRVLKSEQAPDDFNARYSAKRKKYRYSAFIADISLPLKDRYALWLQGMPDIEAMKKAAEIFVGEHDFKSFSSTGSEVKTTVRTIYSLDVKEDNGDITIEVCGNGFLYNMVRVIAGSLFAVGYGKTTINALIEALSGAKRPNVCTTLPAQGLCLVSVDYDG